MTSNAGAREMSTQTIGFGDKSQEAQSKGIKAIEKYFSPEFRNRLDGIISFNSLTVEIMERIVEKFIKELNDQLIGKKVTVSISDGARTWMAKKGYDPRYGARPLTRLIQNHIKDVLSDEILFGRLEKGGSVFVDHHHDKDELDFTYIGG
jgi:ATP-dependent Clp protease ATP-binding subunit ClpA